MRSRKVEVPSAVEGPASDFRVVDVPMKALEFQAKLLWASPRQPGWSSVGRTLLVPGLFLLLAGDLGRHLRYEPIAYLKGTTGRIARGSPPWRALLPQHGPDQLVLLLDMCFTAGRMTPLLALHRVAVVIFALFTAHVQGKGSSLRPLATVAAELSPFQDSQILVLALGNQVEARFDLRLGELLLFSS